MFRIFILAILCLACNNNSNRSRLSGDQRAGDHYLSFLKDSVNPLLQNLETTAAKRKLDSIRPLIQSLDSALRYARAAYFLAEKIDTPGLPFICLKLYDIYEKIGDLEMQKKIFVRGIQPQHQPQT